MAKAERITHEHNPTQFPVAEAIARHKAAEAAYDACPRSDMSIRESLLQSEHDACEELAATPCVNDEEFLEKIRYLCSREFRMFGAPIGNSEYGSIIVAVATHLEGTS